MAVEEGNNGEETEVKEEMMPTQEHVLQMLDMSNTLIFKVNNIEEPSTKAEE